MSVFLQKEDKSMKKCHIAVKDLAILLYQSGDLSSEFFYNHDLNDGKTIHKYWQKKYNQQSQAEVYICHKEELFDYEVELVGFIDGVLLINEEVIIEEIKSTNKKLEDIDENYHLEYLAQLKIYASLYLVKNKLTSIKGRLTFINADSYETKIFNYSFEKAELISFYQQSVKDYLVWHEQLLNDYLKRRKTIQELRFPFPDYRYGQKELMKAIYCIIKEKKILYAMAPTGIGKTISVLYPSIKSLKEMNEKIFYLTAKSTQKEQAINTVSNMVKSGLSIRLLAINSKEEMCFLSSEFCDVDSCPYAKDFFQKMREAVKDALRHSIITKSVVYEIAGKYTICPFEFSLNISNYCDIIVCDYNYLFDPIVKLQRYFTDETEFKAHALVDEAHNLVDRSRNMLSCEISIDAFKEIKRSLRGKKPTINSKVNQMINYLNEYIPKLEAENNQRMIFTVIDSSFLQLLNDIIEKCHKIFVENSSFKNRIKAVKLYFECKKFLKIADFFGESHRFVI